jgi:hypothetical protein
MSDISTNAMMREAAMMDASDNHVWARKVRRLCIERDKLKAQIAALPPAPDAEADKLRRTIAARDRRIERLVAALDVARAKGYVTQAEQEPPIVLSAPDAVDALVKAADFAEFITDDERMTDIDLTYVPMGAIRRLRAALAAIRDGRNG